MKTIITLPTLLFIAISQIATAQNFSWAKSMGGASSNYGNSIAVDGSGNVYTTGTYMGTVDFDPGPGTYNLTSGGIFISKLDASGNFLWAKALILPVGSSNVSKSITVDGAGNVYTTGFFNASNADFDPGAGTFNLSSSGFEDIFISKLDASGNFLWAGKMGSSGNDYGLSTAVDASGNMYTTGYFGGTVDFDPGAGTFNLTSVNGANLFVSKLDASGNFLWAKAAGDSLGVVYSFAIAVDGAGNVYTAGELNGTVDFDPGAGTFNLTSAGNGDIFVCKLDGSGNFLWAGRMGSASYDHCNSMALDGAGNVYTTGSFQGIADFDPGAGTFNLTPAGSDIFISKLATDGSFVSAQKLGGGGTDLGRSITVGSTGNIYTTGYFNAVADFDPGAGTFNLTSSGQTDIFISKLDASGNFLWAGQMGGTSFDDVGAIAVDGSGIYTVGQFQGTIDFDPGAGTFNLTAASLDIFVTKLDNVTGIEESFMNGEIKISPNPATNELKIENGELKIDRVEIYNVLGEKVFPSPLAPLSLRRGDGGEGILSVSSLHSGIYFVKMKGDKEERVAKFVKQ